MFCWKLLCLILFIAKTNCSTTFDTKLELVKHYITCKNIKSVTFFTCYNLKGKLKMFVIVLCNINISDSLYLFKIVNDLNASVTFQTKPQNQYYTGSKNLYIADIHCNNVLIFLAVILQIT